MIFFFDFCFKTEMKRYQKIKKLFKVYPELYKRNQAFRTLISKEKEYLQRLQIIIDVKFSFYLFLFIFIFLFFYFFIFLFIFIFLFFYFFIFLYFLFFIFYFLFLLLHIIGLFRSFGKPQNERSFDKRAKVFNIWQHKRDI